MEKLIIVITQKKKLGYMFIPHIADFQPNTPIKLVEPAVPGLFNSKEYPFTEEEKKVIQQLYNINEKSIFKIFSKEKTLKLFFDKLNAGYATTHIRPYIEKHIVSSLPLIIEAGTPVYYKDPNYSNLYESDRIELNREPADALFLFNLEQNTLTYTLKIFSRDKTLDLHDREITELTTEPAILMIENNLYWFKNIDSKKFRPFKEKYHISIPERSIDTYMSKFVKKCLLNHRVEASGFTISDASYSHRAVLSLETDLARKPALTLRFRYGDKEFLPNTRSPVFVYLNTADGKYTFTRLQRDIPWENNIKELLISLGLNELNDSQYSLAGTDDETGLLYSLVSWINKNSPELKMSGIEITQKHFEKTYFTNNIKVDFYYHEKNNWFDIDALVKAGDFEIPFYKFRKHIIENKREYELPDGSIFIIPEEWFTRYYDILFHSEVEDESIKLNRVFFQLLNASDLAPVEHFLSKRILSLYRHTESKTRVPASIKADLRPYQKEGFKWLHTLYKNSFGGILADDMGLGKTLQTITLLVKLYENSNAAGAGENKHVQLSLFDTPVKSKAVKRNVPASLIVMPTSLIHNWQSEIKRFAPQLKTYIYTGNKRLKTKDIGKILRHYHVVLTTYGIVRNDIDYLTTYDFLYAILDESQYIKNPSSKTYKAVSEIRSKHRLVLTGTPIENSLTDLWAQMNFVNDGLLGSYSHFRKHYIKPITKGENEKTQKKLQLLIDPFILRRTKEMVATELPPLTEQVVLCDMTTEQKEVYEREKSGARNELLNIFDKVNNDAIFIFKALTRLRQIANHPVLVDKNYSASSGKYEQVISGIEDIVSEKHKVLVFSSFVKDLELIEGQLKQKKIRYSKLTGATTNRKEAIGKFTTDDDCRVFLISLKAGGVGLNLVEADYVFMLNPWWNPAAESQAINRAHRIGQTKKVFVYKFLSSETIEEKIAHLQKKKQDLADTFITSENLLKIITKEELKNLLT